MDSTSPVPDALPQEDETWQGQYFNISFNEEHPLWFACITHPDSDLILAHQLHEKNPSTGWLWDTLLLAMQNTLSGKPYRPTRLHVRPDKLWEQLKSRLKRVGIRLVAVDELELVDGFPELVNRIFVEWDNKHGNY